MKSQIQVATQFLPSRRWFLLTLSILAPLALLSFLLLSVSVAGAGPLTPEARVTGTVVDPGGSPITQATWVCVGHFHPAGWWDWLTCSESANDGSFTFTKTFASDYLPADAFIWAEAPEGSGYYSSLMKEIHVTSNLSFVDAGPITLTHASFAGMVYEPDGTTPADLGWVGVYELTAGEPVEVTGGAYQTGTYAVGGVPSGHFWLAAHPPEDSLFWYSEPVPVTVTPGSQYNVNATQPHSLTLQNANLFGSVAYPDGSPVTWIVSGTDEIIGRAHVNAISLDGVVEEGRSTASGGEFGLLVPPGDYWVWADPEGLLVMTYTHSVPQSVNVPPTGTLAMPTGPLALTYPSFTGMVFGPDGELITGCLHIWLENMAGEILAEDKYCGYEGLPYMLGGVWEGDYWLRTGGLPEHGLFPADPVLVHVAPGSQYDPDATQVIHLVLSPEAGISGYVRDCDAIPELRIEGAYVVAHSEDWSFEHWDVTDHNGEFKISGVISGTPYILEAFPPKHSDYVAQEPIVVVPITTGVVLEMCIPPTNVVGVVHDYTGAPMPGATVAVFNDHHWDDTGTDELGGFQFRGMPVGEFWVQAAPPWDVQGLLASNPFTVAITHPDTLVDVGVITLPQALKTVTGHVVYKDTGEAARGAVVRAHRLDDEGYAYQPTDPDGGFTISLSGGEWHLGVEPHKAVDWLFPGPPEWIAFELPVTQTEVITSVTIEVVRTNAKVTGQILCPDGNVLDPCPNGPPHWAIWAELRNDDISNGAEVGADYRFEIPIPDGWYELVVHVDHPDWQGPEPRHIAVHRDQVLDVGDVVLLQKDARIIGQVHDKHGNGVAGVPVVAWQHEGIGWGWAETDASGYYTMPVIGGEWFVAPGPGDDLPYVFREKPRLVRVAPNGTMSGVDFELTWANSLIRGAAVDASDGQRIWGLDGWAWAELADTAEFFSEAPMWDSGFSLKVSGGYTYNVGLHVPPYAPYVSGGYGPVPVARGSVATITVPLAHKDAAIEGQLIDASTGLPPAKPVWAGVFGEDEQGHWTVVHVDPHSADYMMEVVSGTWHLRAWVDPESGYVAPPTPTDVSVQSRQVISHNFKVWPIDAYISGTLYHPNGTPLTTTAFVFATGESPFVGYFEAHTKTDENGNFELHVPAGRYLVGAGLPHDELESREWLNPPPIEGVVASPGKPATGLKLRFRRLDGEIVGTVAFSTTASVTATHAAYVWGWAESGEWAETEATVVSGTNTFAYSMKVVSDTVWHIGAVYEDWDNGVYYESAEAAVPVRPPSGKATQPLTLTGPYVLPQPFIVSFDASQMQTIVMPDGTTLSIPPGALAISGTVTLYIFPTHQLRPEKGREIIGTGYEIWATDASGQEIAKFNQDVVVTFHYPSDAELAMRGISEYQLIPVYYSTLVGRWVLADSYVVDTDNNEIVLQISHFSRWGVASTSGGGKQIYLPLLLRNLED